MSSIHQSSFDASFHQNLSVMKLFPGGPHAMAGMTGSSPLVRTPGFGSQSLPHQTYPADFSNYGPMYSSYYAKQAMAAQQSAGGQVNHPARTGSPYQRNGMYSPSNPAAA